MSSASSPARRALEAFVAGRLPAEEVVVAVAGRYYGGAPAGERDVLRAVLEVVERAAPGTVALERRDGGAGFAVRLVERRFPREHEDALRAAAVTALAAPWTTGPAPGAPGASGGGWLARLAGAVRRWFSASA
jgi:hypothetical protein